jgi:hypothetical protein
MRKKRKYSSEASVTKKGKFHQITTNPKMQPIKQEIKQEHESSGYTVEFDNKKFSS